MAAKKLRDAKRRVASYNNMLRAKYEEMHHDWKKFEINRQSHVRQLTGQEKEKKAAYNKFAGVVHNMASLKRDDKITAFPASLDSEIKGYDTGIKAILGNKTDMTDAENKAAIARNKASDALAAKHNASAKARGKVNQEVKQKLIW